MKTRTSVISLSPSHNMIYCQSDMQLTRASGVVVKAVCLVDVLV